MTFGEPTLGATNDLPVANTDQKSVSQRRKTDEAREVDVIVTRNELQNRRARFAQRGPHDLLGGVFVLILDAKHRGYEIWIGGNDGDVPDLRPLG